MTVFGAIVTRSSLSASSSLASKRFAKTLANVNLPFDGETSTTTQLTGTHSRWFSAQSIPKQSPNPPLDAGRQQQPQQQPQQQKQVAHQTDKSNGSKNGSRRSISPADDKKIQHILNEVPVGTMTTEMVSFSHNTINRLCQYPTVASAAAAEEILDRLVREIDSNPALLSLSALSYTRIIRAWARTSPETAASIFYARELLTKMQQRHDTCQIDFNNLDGSENTGNRKRHPAPDTYTYNSFLYACTMSSHEQVVAMAQDVVNLVEAQSLKDLCPVRADTSIYNSLILVYANQADRTYGAAAAAEDCLLRLSTLALEGGPRPDTQSFNRVLKAWAMSQEDNGADRALQILKLLIKLQDQHDVRPDPISFGTVINAFARRKRPEEANEVFQQALEYYKSDTPESTKPPVDLTNCFNTISLAWAKSGHAEAPERVEALLREAYRLQQKHDSSSNSNVDNNGHGKQHSGIFVTPNVQLHTHGIEALVKSGRKDGIDRADQLLRDMVYSFVNTNNNSYKNSDNSNNNISPSPSTGTFGVVINAWLRSERPKSAERAEALLRLMMDLAETKGADCAPEATTFTMCLTCWTRAKSPHAPEKAYNLLEMMEQRKMIKFYCYKAVINTLCRTRRPEAAFTALKLLQRMKYHVESNVIEKPLHMIGLYTAVVAALAKIETLEAAELALDALRGVPEGVKATSRTYTGVIHAFSRLQGIRPAAVAMELFEEMRELDADPESKVTLDRVVFLTVLESLANAGSIDAGNQACRVLGMMIEMHEKGRKDIEPSSKSYDACLVALTRSGDPGNVTRAADLLKTLVSKYSEKSLSHLPSQEAFQAVIRGCNKGPAGTASKEAEDITRIMEKVFHAGDVPVQ
jgi:pentatricopeptide repeat protein